jgi:hypothetical protein
VPTAEFRNHQIRTLPRVRVLTIDGSLSATAIADMAADHFSPYLPPATATT